MQINSAPSFVEDDADAPSSLSHQAYQRLADRIITLRLPPGAPINETALMDELKLGRTPVREALQRLAYEGLVILRPRRGASEADLSILDLQQIFELRRLVEGHAAALAAERAGEADLAAMRAALAGLDSLAPNAPPEAYIAVDRAFHRTLARAAHNRFLEETLSRLYNLNLRLWYLALDKIGPMRAAVDEHRRILEAVAAHDGPQAEAAMRGHITHFQNRIRELL
ncbi:MAG: GntR family transcriptional regulator [Anaerolineales bacterium]